MLRKLDKKLDSWVKQDISCSCTGGRVDREYRESEMGLSVEIGRIGR